MRRTAILGLFLITLALPLGCEAKPAKQPAAKTPASTTADPSATPPTNAAEAPASPMTTAAESETPAKAAAATGAETPAKDDTPAVAAEKIFPTGAKLEELWNEGEFTEGAACAPDGAILFSDIPDASTGKIFRFDPASKKVTVHCADSRKSNGLAFTKDGRLLAACGANDGGRAVSEITQDGLVIPLVSEFEGKLLNAPNDLDVDAAGNIYFSDPFYVGKESIDLDHMSVFFIDTSTMKPVRVTTEITKPNGVALSPDGKTLYVAETNNGTPRLATAAPEFAAWRMTLNAFPVLGPGKLGPRKILVDFGKQAGIDGMTCDAEGRIYAAIRNETQFGIAVYSPEGKEVAFLRTPALPTNCCFGSASSKEERHRLYITAGKGLYRVTTIAAGPAWFPPK